VNFPSALIGKIAEIFRGYFRKYTVCWQSKYLYAEEFYRQDRKGISSKRSPAISGGNHLKPIDFGAS
jgi:hypothetical protein